MKLLLGLGNVGKDYHGTRHNFGFLAVDMLRQRLNAPAFSRMKKCHAVVTNVHLGNHHRLLLAKPTTMMNDSGKAAAALLHYYDLSVGQLWVFHDDIDLPVGTVRLAFDSGSAGHNGVQSIIEALGTQTFNRIRIGVGRPGEHAAPVEDYVLQQPSDADRAAIIAAMEASLPSVVDRFA